MCPAGFKLSISWSQNVMYFSIITMSKKSHFTIFTIQNFVQNMNVFVIGHLCCCDHVCKVNEWCLGDCFHHQFRVSTKIMVHVFPLKSPYGPIFFAIQSICINSTPAWVTDCIERWTIYIDWLQNFFISVNELVWQQEMTNFPYPSLVFTDCKCTCT